MTKNIEIPWYRWGRLIRELRRRGRGERESGAFLLAKKVHNTSRISHCVYYDDIDPHALDKGYVHIDGGTYGALWRICKKHKLSVVADIHTHPGNSTRQSESDRTHPMIPEFGHVAIIAPCFAQFFCLSSACVSVYRYQGNYQWVYCKGSDRAKVFRITCL